MSENVKMSAEILLSTRFSLHRAGLLWLLFFVICFGLGYPMLNRYDPGRIPGTADAAGYFDAVRSPLALSPRLLVPALAKPFYLLSRGRIGSWDPVRFGMLVASSMLTAGTAIILLLLGFRSGFPDSTSLLAALLFLVNFSVPNWTLSGYVDSGEAFFLALLAWSLLSERWYLLPVWAILGSLAKDTFAPFAFVFALIWWLVDRPIRFARALWIVLFAVLSGATVLALLGSGGGFFSSGLDYARGMKDSHTGILRALLGCLTSREVWLVFAWLIPLGVMRIRRLDRRWVWAAFGSFILAALMAAYDNAHGNAARPMFNIAGPLLSLAAADFLTTARRSTASAGASES